MATTIMYSLLRLPQTLLRLFQPTIDALLGWHIPWRYRWRLLTLQPVSLLTYSLTSVPWWFSSAYTVEDIPIAPGRSLRAIVFKDERGSSTAGTRTDAGRKLRPLHVDIHGGAFIGGQPEDEASYLQLVAKRTGAVVIGLHYRYAPRWAFPAAIDDIDAALAYLCQHAEARFGADPTLLTVSGFSAGGNLALAAALAEGRHGSSPTAIKATTTFCAAIDLRLWPGEKPKPPNFPKSDPTAFLLPLFDSYAGPVREGNMANPRLSPIVADVDSLPESMFVGIAGIDILLHEQQTFVDRVKADFGRDAKYADRRIESVVDPLGFHGYLNRRSSFRVGFEGSSRANSV